MNVLLINGSPHKKGCTYTALSEVAGQLEKNGIGSNIVHIGSKPIRGCIACGACRETGLCVFDDDPVNELLRALEGGGWPYRGVARLLCGSQRRAVRFLGSPVLYEKRSLRLQARCRRGQLPPWRGQRGF